MRELPCGTSAAVTLSNRIAKNSLARLDESEKRAELAAIIFELENDADFRPIFLDHFGVERLGHVILSENEELGALAVRALDLIDQSELGLGRFGSKEITPDEDIREIPLGTGGGGAECTVRLKVLPRRERIGSEIPLILFPSAILLARHLWANPSIVRSKDVLELGAGLGLCGLAAAMCGARSVRLTDLNLKSVAQMARHAQENCAGKPEICVPEAAVLDWMNLPPLTDEGDANINDDEDGSSLPWRQYDVIIGSDITHGDNHGVMVFDAMMYFMKRDGETWIASPDEAHDVGLPQFQSLVRSHGELEYECLVMDDADLSELSNISGQDVRGFKKFRLHRVRYKRNGATPKFKVS